MRFLSITFRTLLLLLLSLPLLLAVMMLEREPRVPEVPAMTEAEMDRVQQLLIDNDPRRLLEEENQRILLGEGDADILWRYLLAQTGLEDDFRGRVDIEEGVAYLQLSRPLPGDWLDAWLNIQITFNEDRHPLAISGARIGALDLPRPLIDHLIGDLMERYREDPNVRLLTSVIDTIEYVDLDPDEVIVGGTWDNEGLDTVSRQARDVLLSQSEQARIGEYYRLLMAAEEDLLARETSRVSLNRLMTPLFREAYEKALDGVDPVLENRALLLALALYMSDLDLTRLANETDETIRQHQRRLMVTLHSRLDLAQHLAISAAIAASASGSIAEMISVYKETHDARYRSGFSFDDLTANQVGLALGNIATSDHSSAHRLQHMLRAVEDEGLYMPDVTLDEVMDESAFAEYYGDRQSPAFLDRLDAINDSIAERPLFDAFERRKIGI